jgi:hypothetical protein
MMCGEQISPQIAYLYKVLRVAQLVKASTIAEKYQNQPQSIAEEIHLERVRMIEKVI